MEDPPPISNEIIISPSETSSSSKIRQRIAQQTNGFANKTATLLLQKAKVFSEEVNEKKVTKIFAAVSSFLFVLICLYILYINGVFRRVKIQQQAERTSCRWHQYDENARALIIKNFIQPPYENSEVFLKSTQQCDPTLLSYVKLHSTILQQTIIAKEEDEKDESSWIDFVLKLGKTQETTWVDRLHQYNLSEETFKTLETIYYSYRSDNTVHYVPLSMIVWTMLSQTTTLAKSNFLCTYLFGGWQHVAEKIPCLCLVPKEALVLSVRSQKSTKVDEPLTQVAAKSLFYTSDIAYIPSSLNISFDVISFSQQQPLVENCINEKREEMIFHQLSLTESRRTLTEPREIYSYSQMSDLLLLQKKKN